MTRLAGVRWPRSVREEQAEFLQGAKRSPFVGGFVRFELPYPKVKY